MENKIRVEDLFAIIDNGMLRFGTPSLDLTKFTILRTGEICSFEQPVDLKCISHDFQKINKNAYWSWDKEQQKYSIYAYSYSIRRKRVGSETHGPRDNGFGLLIDSAIIDDVNAYPLLLWSYEFNDNRDFEQIENLTRILFNDSDAQKINNVQNILKVFFANRRKVVDYETVFKLEDTISTIKSQEKEANHMVDKEFIV